MKRFFFSAFIFLFIVMLFGSWDTLDIKGELSSPGTKLVAVDFYATWCKPCNEAIPRWKKLQEKYGHRGLKVVVVSVQSQGTCASTPNWTPDKVICDYEGQIASRWNANELPQAFLWSWQGNLLVDHGHVTDVEKAVEKYFSKVPRIIVDDPVDQNGKELFSGDGRALKQLIRSKLKEYDKIEVIATKEEKAALRKLRKESHKLNYDNASQCKLGMEISANSLLKIHKIKFGRRTNLVLEVFSAEKGCLTATATAPLYAGKLETAVAGVTESLMRKLLGNVNMPGAKQRSTPKERSYGGKEEWSPDSSAEYMVKFESEPTGAVVMIDNKMICQQTPCSRMVSQGIHKMVIALENYETKNVSLNVSKNMNVSEKMSANFGELSVTSQPSEKNVYINGKNKGTTPAKLRLNPGTYKVEVRDDCYVTEGWQVIIKKGASKTRKAELSYKPSAIKAVATDEKGNVLSGKLYVDGEYIGKVPGTHKVPLCSKKAEIKTEKGSFSKELDLKEKKVFKIVAKISSNPNFPLKHARLRWSKKAPKKMKWKDAKNYCENLVEDGSSDWRLPTISELRTLIKNCSKTETGGSCGVTDSCLSYSCWKKNNKACGGCSYDKSGKYSVFGDTGWLWSSSVLSDDTDAAWGVAFVNGRVDSLHRNDEYSVRCVR